MAPVPKLADRAAECAQRLRAADEVLLASHIDADGLTSAGIATRALERAEIPTTTVFKNQLDDEERHGTRLHEEGILYAPDYLANSGRTIDDTDLLRKGGYNHERARAMIDGIYDRMMDVGRRSEREDRPTYAVANEVAEERIEAVGSMRPKVHDVRDPVW